MRPNRNLALILAIAVLIVCLAPAAGAKKQGNFRDADFSASGIGYRDDTGAEDPYASDREYEPAALDWVSAASIAEQKIGARYGTNGEWGPGTGSSAKYDCSGLFSRCVSECGGEIQHRHGVWAWLTYLNYWEVPYESSTSGTHPTGNRGDVVVFFKNGSSGESTYDAVHIGICTGGTKYVSSLSAKGSHSYAGVWETDMYYYTSVAGSVTTPVFRIYRTSSLTGKLMIRKTSAASGITSGSSLYSLEGTEFTVRAQDGSTAAVLTCTSDGTTGWAELPAGTYTVKETKAGKGYLIDSNPVTVEISAGDQKEVSFSDVPVLSRGGIVLGKYDADTGSALPQGSGSFEGAVFKVEYFQSAGASGSPARTWYFKTDSGGKLSFDETHRCAGDQLYTYGGSAVLPLGSISVTETEAPRGYTVRSGSLTADITENNGNAVLTWEDGTSGIMKSGNAYLISENGIRGSVRVKKNDSATGAPLAGAEFTVYAMEDMNIGDRRLSAGETVIVMTTVEDGIAETAARSLPYGKYVVRETRAPLGYTPDREWHREFSINSDGQTVDLTSEPVGNGPVEIKTSAYDSSTGFRSASVSESFKAMDMVSLTGLETGRSYRLVCSAVLQDGTPVAGEDGEQVSVSIEFTADNAEMEMEIGPVAFDSSGMAGLTVVLTERLYDITGGAEELRAVHEDLSDEEQTLRFPSVSTTASDSATGDNQGVISDDAGIIDEVQLDNLVPGTEYTLKGTVVLKGEEEVLAAAEKIFTADEAEMTVDMEFGLDSRDLAGKSAVVYEELTAGGTVLASHMDPDDPSQTVTYPSIGTSAVSGTTGSSMGSCREGETIVDTVSYEGLIPGEEYELEGRLVFSGTGEEVLLDGVPVTAHASFVPETSSGETQVVFRFDSRQFAGETLTVFEKLHHLGVEIASHEDENDSDQSVYYPEISTMAADSRTGASWGKVGKPVTVVDKVFYENLIPGEEYEITGALVDSDGAAVQDLSGAPASSSLTFVPETSDGTLTVSFEDIPSESVIGKDTVCTETLLLDGNEIAKHEDLGNRDQTTSYIEKLGKFRLMLEESPMTINVEGRTPSVDTGVSAEYADEPYAYTEKKTVKSGNGLIPILAAAAAIASAGGVILYRRRRSA
ncbi:MAG: VaFE repeat-containing surface-anchored protein [Oscillospiraceae bacterium]